MLKVLKGFSLVSMGLTTFSFLYLSGSSVLADDITVDDISVLVPVSCTMSSSGENSHTATVPNNTTRSDIGTTTVNAFCNDGGGFAIYAIGYTDDTYGKTVLASATLGSTKDIATGTATSGSSSNWAMKLTNTGTTYPVTIQNSFGSYQDVPNTYTLVASRTSGTAVGTGATGSTFTTTYQVFVSATQPADTYTGKVKYTMVHPSDEGAPVPPLAEDDCLANKICYAPNAGDIVGSMDSISSTKITSSATAGVQNAGSNAEYTLIAPNYSRAGYGFAGWSTDFNVTNSSTIYGPNESITTGDLSSHGLILYPVWIKSTGTMQTWHDCDSLTTAPTATRPTLASMTALTDTRDDNVYTVARLADSKCWMTENLRLNNTNSDNATGALAQGYGDDTANNLGKFMGLANSEKSSFGNYTDANSIYYSGTTSGTATINVGTNDRPNDRIPRYNNSNTNRSLTASYNSTSYTQWHGYGNYYNWAAAIASTGSYMTSNASVTSTSICPAGWRLAQGGNKSRITSYNDNDFWTLIVTYLNSGTNPANYASQARPYYTGSTEGVAVSKLIRKFPNNYVYSGYLNPNATNRSSYGYYWSSTSDGTATYFLQFNSSAVYPGTYNYGKASGRSVRCLAEITASQ